MENRFGLKDFVLLASLGLVIVLVILSMVQFDRQWDQVQAIRQKLEQQAIDLQAMQQQISRGVVQQSSTQPATNTQLPPSLERVAAARALPGFAEGDWVVSGQGGKFSTITPVVSGDAYANEVQSNVLETLCVRDPVTLEWQGLLAESWKVTDNSAAWDAYALARWAVPVTEAEVLAEPDCPPVEEADARKAYVQNRMKQGRKDDNIGREPNCPSAGSVRMKLRRNPTFSDGKPLTADDVVFTFNWIMNPAIDAPRQRAYLSRIRSVTKIADDEVEFVFSVPYFESFDLVAGFEVMPKHYYEKFSPSDFNSSTGFLLGSGPYMLGDPWKPGDLMQLVRNPRYWAVQSAFSRLVYREFTSRVALETAFRNGEIDSLTASPEQFVGLKKDASVADRSQAFEYQSAVGGYRYVAWNQFRRGKPTMFADKRVRQAMTLLVDQPRLLSDVMLDMAVPATGPFNPASKQNDPTIKPYAYDPARAAKLLEEAGWRDRGEGVLTNDAGERFEFKLTYPSANPNYEKMVLLLRDLYARAKVRLQPDPQEWSVFRDRLKNKEFDSITLAWSAGIETDIYQMFHSTQTMAGGDNFMSYRSPELDKLIDSARRTLDENKRMELWRAAHRQIYEDQPYTFLFFPKALIFLDKRISNVQKLPLGLNSDREWFVPKASQRWTK